MRQARVALVLALGERGSVGNVRLDRTRNDFGGVKAFS